MILFVICRGRKPDCVRLFKSYSKKLLAVGIVLMIYVGQSMTFDRYIPVCCGTLHLAQELPQWKVEINRVSLPERRCMRDDNHNQIEVPTTSTSGQGYHARYAATLCSWVGMMQSIYN